MALASPRSPLLASQRPNEFEVSAPSAAPQSMDADMASPRKRRRMQPQLHDPAGDEAAAGAGAASTSSPSRRATRPVRRGFARTSLSLGAGRRASAAATGSDDDDDDGDGDGDGDGHDDSNNGDAEDGEPGGHQLSSPSMAVSSPINVRAQRRRPQQQQQQQQQRAPRGGEGRGGDDEEGLDNLDGLDGRTSRDSKARGHDGTFGRPSRRSAGRRGSAVKGEDSAGASASPAEVRGDDTHAEDSDAKPSTSRHGTRAKSQSASPQKGGPSQSQTTDPSKRRERLPEEQDAGWIEEIESDDEACDIYMTIINRIQRWLDEKGNQAVASFMENGPPLDATTSIEVPMSLFVIRQRVQTTAYPSSIDFEKDMLQLFYNGRRFFALGTSEYGSVVTLQRMYQHLTQSVDDAREEIDEDTLSRNCSSVRYGPSQAPPGQPGFGETLALGKKFPTNKHKYKGRKIVVGNWIHLANPTDPARPIVAQVFKTRSEDLGDHNQDWITACWFLRPEQTRHTRAMHFWENEVIKTNMLVEHHVEDVLEMACVMHSQRYARGRPANGEGGWRTGDPLYVCEMRFLPDRNRFSKIKNWASGMPEDTKSKRFDMVLFDEPKELAEKLPSPFARGIEGPGELVTEIQLQAEAIASTTYNGGPGGAREASAESDSGKVLDVPQLFKEWSDEMHAQRRAFLRSKAQHRAREQAASHSSPNRPSSSPAAVHQSPPRASSGSTPLTPVNSVGASRTHPARAPLVAQATDRSLAHAMSQVPEASGHVKPLPPHAQQLFHQDPETGTVVWYAAPPVAAPTQANLQRKWNGGERFQAHSLDYLYHLATAGPTSRTKGSGGTGMRRNGRTTSQGSHSQGTGDNDDTDLSLGEGEQDGRTSASSHTKPASSRNPLTLDNMIALDLTGTEDSDPNRALGRALQLAGTKLSRQYEVE